MHYRWSICIVQHSEVVVGGTLYVRPLAALSFCDGDDQAAAFRENWSFGHFVIFNGSFCHVVIMNGPLVISQV